MNNKYVTNNFDPTSVTIISENNIDDIFLANPNVINFYFQPGNYYITTTLIINKDNVTLQSLSNKAQDVNIFQTKNTDCLLIKNVNNVLITNLSFHNEFDDHTTLTVAGCNYTTVKRCIFRGCSNKFCIFYAGPSELIEGQNTLDAFYNENLDSNNTFTDNIIYSKWSGDSVSYSLQKNGTFNKNIVRGGKIAIYMCIDTIVYKNIVYDSTSNSIIISLPSKNILVKGNRLYDSIASAIKISNQGEHGTFNPFNYNINLCENSILAAKLYGIEINDGYSINIENNKMIDVSVYGIYILRSYYIHLLSNVIAYFSVGVWMENTNYSSAFNNEFNSIFPDEGNNVFKIINNSNNNVITYNTVRGKILYDKFTFDASSSNNIINNNNEIYYYGYEDELNILSF
jgi:hypothetical protein